MLVEITACWHAHTSLTHIRVVVDQIRKVKDLVLILLMNIFSLSNQYRFRGDLVHVSRPNFVKIGRWEIDKISSGFDDKILAARDTSEPPILLPLGLSHPKFPELCRP